MRIDFHRHSIPPDSFQKVREVLDSGFLTTGKVCEEFESKFSVYLGAVQTISLSSCTAALFLSLKAFDIAKGDEVIVPALTFVATANAVLHAGATPVFVDIDPVTGLIDLDQLKHKITYKTKAIIPVQLYGQMVDMLSLKAIADKNNLVIIEDAAHCVEGKRDGIRPAGLSDVACFSFYATKNITSGEGGAIATNNKKLASKLYTLRSHGIDKSVYSRYRNFQHWDMLTLGYKANLSDIQAALLLPQMDVIEGLWDKRRKLFGYYCQKIKDSDIPVKIVAGSSTDKNVNAHHLFVIKVTERLLRDKLITYFQKHGVETVVNYRAVHLNTYYQKKLQTGYGDYPQAEKLGDLILSLPFYPNLSFDEVDYIVSILCGFFKGRYE